MPEFPLRFDRPRGWTRVGWRGALVLMLALPWVSGCREGASVASESPAAGSRASAAVEDPPVRHAMSRPLGDANYPIVIRRPAGAPRIEFAGADPAGGTASVACSTCHSIREPKLDVRSAEELDQFHQGMTFQHGQLTCYACHHPDDADALRLADATTVAYVDVMQLCAQCHGPQATAYAHGAHGGMNGYWDRTRGPQTKNHCIDCHDPHAPAFPRMAVTFKPKDRFLIPPDHADDEEVAHDDVP